MAKVDIFSGFLGAGKTSLIKKLINEAYKGEKVVLIENEFGDIGIDGGFLKDSGIEVNEMNSGCICCSLVGDFGDALNKVISEFNPDRILIEPSGVGKLSDVIMAVKNLENPEIMLNGFTTVVDAKKCKMYMKNFGEFFNNQVEHASAIILSHVQSLSEEKIDKTVEILREHNKDAAIITTDWDELTGKQILETMEQKNTIESELERLKNEIKEDHHAHHHDEDCCCGHDHHEDEHHHEHEHHHHDEDCCCGHDHHEHEHHHEHHDEDCCCGHDHHDHHEHHHDEDCCCGHDHHEHHHDEDCSCGHDHHEHHHEEDCSCGHDHHHHHADEVFNSIGIETIHKFTEDKLKDILKSIENEDIYGLVIRAKGIVEAEDGSWIHFDYVPGEADIRKGSAGTTGMICVIGAGVDEDKVRKLFEL